MRNTTYLLLVTALLIGCTKEPGPGDPSDTQRTEGNGSVSTTPIASAAEHRWAAELIRGSSEWEAVTAKAVPAHVRNFTLCGAPTPGIDDRGPHGASFSDVYVREDSNEEPKSPANQFIVNPIGRGHFYDRSAQVDKSDATPPPHPVGTVIIKEKYAYLKDAIQRHNPRAYGVMIKHEPGYNPEQGDWEYAYIELDEPNKITAATRGKLASCIDCHANRNTTDFVFRNYPLLASPR